MSIAIQLRVGGDNRVANLRALDWILFDPNIHEFPLFYGGQAPATFQKYEHFKPGNKRILELNMATGSVRTKSTPNMLADKRIEYRKTGPVLLDVENYVQPKQLLKRKTGPVLLDVEEFVHPKQARKRKPGRPRKTPAPALTPAAPAVKSPIPVATDAPAGRKRMGTRIRKPVVKVEPKSDGAESDSSALTDLDEDLEIGDSQEGDGL